MDGRAQDISSTQASPQTPLAPIVQCLSALLVAALKGLRSVKTDAQIPKSSPSGTLYL